MVALCSYAGTSQTSLQHAWLQADLRSIDRSKTPWVIVVMHVPWYNSNSGHRAEGEVMRLDMEQVPWTTPAPTQSVQPYLPPSQPRPNPAPTLPHP